MTAAARLTGSLPRPDLSARPHDFTVERDMKSSSERISSTWRQGFDRGSLAPARSECDPRSMSRSGSRPNTWALATHTTAAFSPWSPTGSSS